MTDRARTRLHAPEAQGVTFVELFFDLVFVFAVTQVTALTAHNLTPEGVLRSLVLFWLIWWAWTQFTWTLNPAEGPQYVYEGGAFKTYVHNIANTTPLYGCFSIAFGHFISLSNSSSISRSAALASLTYVIFSAYLLSAGEFV